MNKRKATKNIIAASLSIGILGSGLASLTNQDNALAQVTETKEVKKFILQVQILSLIKSIFKTLCLMPLITIQLYLVL